MTYMTKEMFIQIYMSNVTGSFMCNNESLSNIQEIINNLEQGIRNQSFIDSMYSDWYDIIKCNMYSSLPFKTVRPGCITELCYILAPRDNVAWDIKIVP